MLKPYKKIRTINRTHRRPTRTDPPPALTDLQSLPPWDWCDQCGAEIYRPDTALCTRCANNAQWTIDN